MTMQILSADEYARFQRPRIIITETGEPVEAEEWDYETDPEDDFDDPETSERKRNELIGVQPSQFVEFAIKVPDKREQKIIPYSFVGREYLRLPYNINARRLLLMCGRQVEKSTLLGNKCLTYCCINNSFNVLYVSPTNLQTKTFSEDRLREPIETSEILRAWTTSKLSDSVFKKKFLNRSQVTLRYAYHNADRTRGIPADMILLDEIQDINTDNIPVIEQCASHSMYKIFSYSGTPKSTDNAIQKYWDDHSTQNEWVIPCDRHGTPRDPSSWHWNVLSEDNVSRDGLVCDQCRQLINPADTRAQWVSMNPRVRLPAAEGGLGEGAFEGFRIPQLMVPWVKWSEIWDNYVRYPKGRFYNECLGLAYDAGLRPLEKKDIEACCVPNFFMSMEELKRIRAQLGSASPVFCGIDWGTGEASSYTVLSLGAYINGFFTIFYIHRFDGPELEPPIQKALIKQIIRSYGVDLVGADYGGGYDRNDELQREFGRNRIWKYQYGTPGKKVQWDDGLHRYMVHRTEVMTDIFSAIKRGNVFRFPDYTQFEKPFSEDMLNIFSEYSESAKQIVYKKSPDKSDDALHSILYCFLASMMRIPRFDILNPTAKTGANALVAAASIGSDGDDGDFEG